MFNFNDLFQWERFITPSIIKIFYWLAVGVVCLYGLVGVVTSLSLMLSSVIAGLITLIASLVGVAVGVIFVRIICEFILIVFRMNEHLGAIRNRGEM